MSKYYHVETPEQMEHLMRLRPKYSSTRDTGLSENILHTWWAANRRDKSKPVGMHVFVKAEKEDGRTVLTLVRLRQNAEQQLCRLKSGVKWCEANLEAIEGE